MQAHWYLNRFDRESSLQAQKLLRQTIALDPKNDLAFSDLAISYIIGLTWGWFEAHDEALKIASEAAKTAITLNERNAAAWSALGRVDRSIGYYVDAVSKARRALELSPNTADSHGWLGGMLMFNGELEEAVSELETGIRLSPRDPFNAMWYAPMSVAHFLAGRYEECIRWCNKSFQDLPNALPGMHRPMAAAYAMLDRMDEARGAIEILKTKIPNVSIEATRRQLPFRKETDMAHFLDALRKAGLPEE